MKDYILCCDWGTTSLRIRIVERKSQKMIAEVSSGLGIAKVFNHWKAYKLNTEQNRIGFYLDSLRPSLLELSDIMGHSLKNIPLVISGMASSSIGMKQLSYANVPFGLEGSDTIVEIIERSKDFEHEVFLISGIRTHNDVMRGEEVQLMGMENLIKSFEDSEDILIILPGTHSKHVRIKKDKIINFDTFITGELFALMSQNGLLKEAVQTPKMSNGSADWPYFLEGVNYSGEVGVLQSLFKVRTNELFNITNKEQNYFFLSGLLIGYELRSLIGKNHSVLILCCQNGLFDYYRKAIGVLNMEHLIHLTAPADVDQFTISGQMKVFEHHLIHRS